LAAGLAILHGQQIGKNTYMLSDILLLTLGMAVMTAVRINCKRWFKEPIGTWSEGLADTTLQYLGVLTALITNAWVKATLYDTHWTYLIPLRYVPFFMILIGASRAMIFIFYESKDAEKTIVYSKQ
jgi:hypothetical protein